MEEAFIRGWKGIAKYLGYSERSIKRLHYGYKPIPFYKTNPENPQSKIRIERSLLKAWYKDVIALREHNKLVMQNSFNIGPKKQQTQTLTA